ncbi:MAG: hypothetical protein J0L99_05445 [Chitinophagales bacterium]|nr:hypothetical protein [Chitinophagales bacterium]
MKQKILLPLFAASILALFSCSEIEKSPVEVKDLTQVRQSETQTSGRAPGIVPSDHPIHEFMLNPDKHTFAEFNAFYREQLPKAENESYYANVKGMAHVSLITHYDLLKQSKADIEFYANEMMNDKFSDPTATLALCKGLEKVWPKDKVQAYANARYEKSVAFANQTSDPSELLQQITPLKTFAEQLQAK